MPDNWISEDCLFLSITAPLTPSEGGDGYPVMVYFHSGGFTEGLAADYPPQDSATFAQQGVIGVEANFRLGVLGNMATKTLSGNFGFGDQRLALKWIQLNIAAFGGDPSKVTIIGGSSGATSVIAHLASPPSHGLYWAAAWSSSPLGIRFPTLNDTITVVNSIFKLAGCPENDIECARNLPWESLINVEGVLPNSKWDNPFTPYVDPQGDLPIQPFLAIKNGLYPDVPILASFDRDDALSFVEGTITDPLTAAFWPSYVSTFVDMFMYVDDKAAAATKIEELYPFPADTTDLRPLLADIAVDGMTACPLINMLEGAVSNKKPPIYVYMFDHVYSTNLDSSEVWMRDAVLHGTDYGCVYADYYLKDYTSEEKVFCRSLNSAFSNFFQYGNPNTGRKLIPTLYFPQLNPAGDILIMDIESRISTYPRYGDCLNFWNSVQPFPENQ